MIKQCELKGPGIYGKINFSFSLNVPQELCFDNYLENLADTIRIKLLELPKIKEYSKSSEDFKNNFNMVLEEYFEPRKYSIDDLREEFPYKIEPNKNKK